MLQHLRNCRCYLFLLNVSMICGSQNTMRYDIMALCKLRCCLIIDFLSSRKRPGLLSCATRCAKGRIKGARGLSPYVFVAVHFNQLCVARRVQNLYYQYDHGHIRTSPTQKYIVHTIYCNILSTIYCIVVVNNTNILYCSS